MSTRYPQVSGTIRYRAGVRELPFGDLASVYAWPDAHRWVRAMMLNSLDGAVAGPDGRSGSISCPADRQVLAEVRRLADAVVIGAQTMRAERYSPMRAKPEAAQERAGLGLASAPVLVIVSASLDLPWDEPAFTDSAITPIVVTSATVDASARGHAERLCDLIVVDGADVTALALLDVLERRGLRRIVCEGGPRLLRVLLDADVVDELDFTIAPWIIGRAEEPYAPPPMPVHRFTPATMMVHEGYAFMRYLRSAESVSRP